MPENGKIVVGGHAEAQYRMNLKRGTGEFYDSTRRREGIVLLPEQSASTTSVESSPGPQD